MLKYLRRVLFTRRASELRGPPGFLVRAGQVVWFAALEFRRDFCFERAATLSYATIISLMPIAVLVLGAAVQFGVGDQFIHYLEEKAFPSLAPAFQSQLTEWLESNISSKAFAGVALGVAGLVVILSLLVTAMGGLNAAERIFNRLWDVDGRRSYVQKFLVFWGILTMSPLLASASLWLDNFLVPKGGVVDSLTKGSIVLSSLYHFLVPIVLWTLGITVLYKFLPSATVRIGSALVGAFVASILWEISKRGFVVYLAHTSSVASFYGALGVVPIFFLWVYLTWLIVLWGFEIVYAHQHLGQLVELLDRQARQVNVAPATIALHALARAGAVFASGGPPVLRARLEDELLVSPEDLARALSPLLEKGILVEDARIEGRLILGRDPQGIELDVVLELLPLPEPSASLLPATARLLEEARRNEQATFRGKRLSDLFAPT